MVRRAEVLELAVLGLLADAPLHGYELRKRLAAVLGHLRAISYGSLYPCLRRLVERGWIEASDDEPDPGVLAGRRARIVYELTAAGKERLTEMRDESGPTSWEDESFGVHFALFGQTPADVRLRILEGRRTRMQERMAELRESMARRRERLDRYTLALQEHGLEAVEREVRWLTDLIETEREELGGRSGRPTGRRRPRNR
ncbi:MAG: PadR family transcriptional regulator [Streptosporangiales bacterium]|nr:PadR family transcriptional regulator [Streptosporangiales bacterium]